MFNNLDTLRGIVRQAELDLKTELNRDNGNKRTTCKRALERHRGAYDRYMKLYQKWEAEEEILENIINRTLSTRGE